MEEASVFSILGAGNPTSSLLDGRIPEFNYYARPSLDEINCPNFKLRSLLVKLDVLIRTLSTVNSLVTTTYSSFLTTIQTLSITSTQLWHLSKTSLRKVVSALHALISWIVRAQFFHHSPSRNSDSISRLRRYRSLIVTTIAAGVIVMFAARSKEMIYNYHRPLEREARVIHNFSGSQNQCLNVFAGEKLLVWDSGDPHWVLAKRITDGKVGYVPLDYLQTGGS